MKDVRQQLLTHGWLHTVLAVVLALVVNHLASVWYLRVDLTSNQRHSLSDVARQSVAGLQRPLLARVFFTEDLDTPYHDHRRALLDKLRELATHAEGRLDVVVTDPTGDRAAVQDAARFGVRPLPYAYRAWDRTEARSVFMGVALTYGERQVSIEALPSIERMEMELVRAIRTLRQAPDDAASVGWLLGHGEPDPTQAPPDSPLAQLASALRARSAFRTVAPGDGPIPGDLDVLIVVAPRAPLDPAEVVHLDQFLMGGGSLMLWLSGTQPDFDALVPRPIDHGLYAWLGQLGVVVQRDVLLDREHTEQTVVPVDIEGRGRQLVKLNYPLALTTTQLDRTEPVLRDLPRLVLPFASSLAVADPLPDRVEGQVWARTMPKAISVRGLRTLHPRKVREPLEGEQPGAHPVVVALWGRFPSAFAGQVLPARLDPEAEPFAELVEVGQPARIVTVGSGDAVANNLDFALNTVDWLLEDPALIEIRSRGSAVAPMPPPSRAAATGAKLATVFASFAMLFACVVAVRAGGRG